MTLVKLVVVALMVSAASCRPRESTHELLSRLGFDPVHKPGVNHHKKRVVDDSDKARFGGSYKSDSDSHTYVVRLPPHHPYYSHLQPEKLENEVAKNPVNFPVNGKPSQVYHWNMPILKKLAKHKKAHKHESKIVRLQIKPTPDEDYSFYKKLRKEGKPNVYKLKKEHVLSIKELAEQQNDRPIPDEDASFNDVLGRDSKLTHIVSSKHPKQTSRKSPSKSDSNLTIIKYGSFATDHINKHDGDFKKKKTMDKTPLVYSPAIPKNNSLFKYFPGNGKPKSFYVIDKSESTSRLHRLL